MEEIIFDIIANAGNAKSLLYEAIDYAKNGKFKEAKEKCEESNEYISNAHITQTELITSEINGEKTEVSLLFIHAQDHISAAIELKTLAEYIIDLYEKIYEQKEC